MVSLLASTCDGGGVVFENAKDEAAAKLKLASSSVEGTMDGDKIVFDTVIPQRNDYNGTANAASGSITEAEDEPLVTYNETLNHLNLFENFVVCQKIKQQIYPERKTLCLRFQQTKKLFIIELAFLKGLRKLRKQLRTIKNEKTSSEDSWRTLLEARELKGHMQNLTAPLFEGGEFAVPLDYTGAKKGILILHDTYSFDLAALAKGKTVSRNYPNGPLVMKNDHNMEVEDFYQLTQQVFLIQTYYFIFNPLLYEGFYCCSCSCQCCCFSYCFFYYCCCRCSYYYYCFIFCVFFIFFAAASLAAAAAAAISAVVVAPAAVAEAAVSAAAVVGFVAVVGAAAAIVRVASIAAA